jgi:hypothetical protein
MNSVVAPVRPTRYPATAGVTSEPVCGETFEQRAQQLLLFLVERDHVPAARRLEQELSDWIRHWRRSPDNGFSATEHFLAQELGIIMRALIGPPVPGRPLDAGLNQPLCWLIARCMDDE